MTRNCLFFSCLAGMIVVAGLGGCGDGRPDRSPVSGTILFQGKPIEGAEIMFICKNGRPATGFTDSQGRFEMFTFEPGDGAILGEHAVAITKKVEIQTAPGPYKPSRDLLPERYGHPEKSGLVANVKAGGDNDFTFDLKP